MYLGKIGKKQITPSFVGKTYKQDLVAVMIGLGPCDIKPFD